MYRSTEPTFPYQLRRARHLRRFVREEPMRIVLAAVGRIKDGAERDLLDRFQSRFDAAGRKVSLGPIQTVEVPESRAQDVQLRRDDEAARLLKALSALSCRIVLDERGKSLTSVEFASLLAKLRDGGEPAAGIVIGGPDGHGPAVMERATLRLSLGAMTWPHGLARIFLVEQLYRAVTILSGHPYHRA